MTNKGEVAYKIMGGKKLTMEEFKLAITTGMLTGGKPKSDKEWAEAYLQWIGLYYEDDKREGYLCNKTPTRMRTEMREGKEVHLGCLWGIHMDEVQPDKLTKENLKYLRHYFGKEKVKELMGR